MEEFLLTNKWILILLLIWSLTWKGISLWIAARKKHKWWFVTLLVLTTLGILPILYIFVFSKHYYSKEKSLEEAS